jgi:prolipoprotein diacylglyceryltransferase
LIVAIVALAYAVPRFLLDYLRRETTDPRYGGLTPAQWSCILTVGAAVALLVWIRTHREPPPERYLRATPWRVHLREAFRARQRRAVG